jgi:hypothetical protein
MAKKLTCGKYASELAEIQKMQAVPFGGSRKTPEEKLLFSGRTSGMEGENIKL